MLSAFFDVGPPNCNSSTVFGKCKKAGTSAARGEKGTRETSETNAKDHVAEESDNTKKTKKTKNTERRRKSDYSDPMPTPAYSSLDASTSRHAKFVPLPPEKNVPKPAETSNRCWRTVDSDDNINQINNAAASAWEGNEACAWSDDGGANEEDKDSLASDDFGIDESLDIDPRDASSVSSSLDDVGSVHTLLCRRKQQQQQSARFSGPKLQLEVDDDNDASWPLVGY